MYIESKIFFELAACFSIFDIFDRSSFALRYPGSNNPSLSVNTKCLRYLKDGQREGQRFSLFNPITSEKCHFLSKNGNSGEVRGLI